MRKKVLSLLTLAIILMLYGCMSNSKPILKGFYQTEKDVNGYFIQISIHQDDNSFVEYIDNIEVDRGTYEKTENNTYIMKSDKQNFEIKLKDDNSFEIVIKKLNNGNPIQMNYIDDIPMTFPQIFNDVDEYKALLD